MNEELVSGRNGIRLASARIFASDVRRSLLIEERNLSASVHRSSTALPLSKTADLSRQPIQPGESWGGAWDSGYFRLVGQMPESWVGRTIAFQLDFGGEALVYTPEGQPCVALSTGSVYDFDGAFRKDLVFLPTIDPGEEFTLFVEAVGNALLGVRFDEVSYVRNPENVSGEWTATFQFARFGLFSSEAFQLLVDVEYCLSLYESLAPKGPYGSALLRALSEASYLFYEHRLHEARDRLWRAVSRDGHESGVRAVVAGHAHIDTAWLWPMAEARRKVTRTFANQLDLLDRHPAYVFGASSAQHYDWIRESFPKMFEAIRAYVAAGRWEVQGAMWVEPDCNLVSPESLLRQIEEGNRFWRSNFGLEPSTCWIPDVFGYPVTLPQVLAGSGIGAFLTQKMSWSQFTTFPHQSFTWVGRDGSSVLTHFPPENTYNSLARPQDIKKAEANYVHRGVADEFVVLAGFGDGGGGPTDEHVERVNRSHATPTVPKSSFDRIDLFFDRLREVEGELPRWTGELYLEYHRGTYTSQAMVKKNNRRSEQALRALEALFTLREESAESDSGLRDAIRRMLTLQFHDILPGSSIHQVYVDALADYRRIREAFDSRADALVSSFVMPASKHDQVRLAVFNCLAQGTRSMVDLSVLGLFPSFAGPESVAEAAEWQTPAVERIDGDKIRRVQAIRDPDGISRPFVTFIGVDGSCRLLADVSVEALSLTTLDLLLGGESALTAEWVEETSDEPELSNAHTTYSFSRDGSFVHVPGEPGKRRGNVINLYHDRPHAFEAWDIDFTYPESEAGRPRTCDVYRLTGSSLVIGLRFVMEYGSSHITQDVLLLRGTSALRFDTHVKWNERRKLLRTSFAVNPAAPTARCDVIWGVVERNAHINTEHDFAQFEFPAHGFVDVSHGSRGVAVLSDCKYGWSCRGGRLGLSLLRSPASPDPLADAGEHSFSYVYLPHSGIKDARLVRHAAEELNRPPAVFAVPRNGSQAGSAMGGRWSLPISISGDGVAVFSIRHADDGDGLIVRFGETVGSSTVATLTAAGASAGRAGTLQPTDHMGRPIARSMQDLPAEIELAPFEVCTVRVHFASR